MSRVDEVSVSVWGEDAFTREGEVAVKVCLPGLPRPSCKSVRLGRERSHGADVDDIAREFWHEHFLNVGADLQVVASTGGAQVLHPGNLTGEAEQRKASCEPAY